MRNLLLTALLGLSTLALACGDDDGGNNNNGDVDAGPNGGDPDANPGDPCGDITCVNGTCNDSNDPATCDCDDGWQGASCDALIPPDSNGLVIWLDANDPLGNGTAATTGNAVNVWVDKTGDTTNFLQNTADNQPAIADGPGGNKVVSFDGTDWLTSAAADEIQGFSYYTVIIVGRFSAAEQYMMTGTVDVGGEQNDDPGLLLYNFDGVTFEHRFDYGDAEGDAAVDNTNGLLKTDGLNWIWAYREVDMAMANTFKVGLCVNDTTCTVNGLTTSDDFDAPLDLTLGSLKGNFGLDGEIGEVLVYQGVRTPNADAAILTYLQEKWGL